MTRIPALGPRGEGWVAAQIVLLLLVAVLGAVNLPAVHAETGGVAPIAAGVALMSLGGFLVIQGVRGLGPSLTALPHPRDDASLVTDGIYGTLRHPIYAGLIGLALGWAFVTFSALALLASVALALVLDLKARREEAWLMARFPDYSAYRARTHRFIPSVY